MARHPSRPVVLFGLLALLAWRSPGAVIPGHSTVEGLTLGQWSNEWWKWVAGQGPGPLSDTTGSSPATTANQPAGGVFFLAGTGGGAPAVSRTITVPDNKRIFFPLINWIVTAGPDPGFPDTKTEANLLATNTINPANLFATVDGVPVANLASHREESGALFTITFAPNNDLGFPPGTYNDAYADGYWLMLDALSAGQHTLHFGGTSTLYTYDGGQVAVFSVDTTVRLNVVPAGGPNGVPLPAAIFLAPLGVGPALAVRRKVCRWR